MASFGEKVAETVQHGEHPSAARFERIQRSSAGFQAIRLCNGEANDLGNIGRGGVL